MKIAHVICAFPPYQGGMGNSVACFAKESVKLRHQVTIITPHYGHSSDMEDEWQTLRLIRLKPWLAIGRAAILPKVFKYLPNFDVVHLHYPFYGTAELVALAKIILRNKLKLVVHYHMDTKARGLKGFVFYVYSLIWLPLILRLADEITCASLDYIKHSNVGRYYLRHRQKFTQVSFGVDVENFCPPAKLIVKNTIDILFVGGLDRAHYFKGVDNLIKAFAKLQSSCPQSCLTIVGRGELMSAYERLATAENVADKVKFINDANNRDLVSHYQYSDLLVLPSINQSEAFGLVLLEAMACGRPVLASNLPGVRSVFKNGKQGLTVRPNDIEDLSEKLHWLISHDEARRRMGAAARVLVEKRYDWRQVGEKLNEVYFRVLYASGWKHRNHKNNL